VTALRLKLAGRDGSPVATNVLAARRLMRRRADREATVAPRSTLA
jgi:hypothetical protein